MKRTSIFLIAGATALVPVMYQGTSVLLQASTPGTLQNGNLNISGTARAGTVVGYSGETTGIAYGGDFRSLSTSGRGVLGNASATTGATYGGLFQAASNGGRGIAGIASSTSGTTYGGFFSSLSNQGRGVYGQATSATGTTYGVYGKSDSPTGYGVYSDGNMAATGVISGNGSGVTQVDAAKLGGFDASSYLRAVKWPLNNVGVDAYIYIQDDRGSGSAITASGFSRGGSFSARSANGEGVTGQGFYGVVGRTYDPQGFGVRGVSLNVDNELSVGGYFASIGPAARAMMAVASADSGLNYAGRFENESNSGRGVYGLARATSGITYGVLGQSSSGAGYGVYAIGDSGASGVKSFRIDHPDDPQNKYLLHYSAESPMPQNFYCGTVATDAEGYAWVDLPGYFKSINTNFKYQLTVIGKSFARAIVWDEIEGNRFRIRTDQPNVKVSWEVKADRNDLYVRNRLPKDVVEKEGMERGRYQMPELYGLPTTDGLDVGPPQKVDADLARDLRKGSVRIRSNQSGAFRNDLKTSRRLQGK